MKRLILILLFLSSPAFASLDGVWKLLSNQGGSVGNYPAIVSELVDNQLYFTAVPYIKEYLTKSTKVSPQMDKLIDEVVTYVGVRQFEVLPTSILSKTSSPMIKYILARKYFRKQQYTEVLTLLGDRIPENHPAKPFALFLEGSTLSIGKKYDSAIHLLNRCIRSSNYNLGKFKSFNRKRQLEINRDYCRVGISRAEFASKKYDDAYLSYLDLPKESPIWPEILFEEAWNSFYLKDYNRTLGKLVTYKAPLLTYIFNPEIEVLKGLTYLEMCLWTDLKKVVEDFYSDYERDSENLRKLLNYNNRNYKYYYLMAKSRKEGVVKGSKLYNQLLKYLVSDPTYIEMYDNFQNAREELSTVRLIKNDNLKRIFAVNLRESLLLQRNLIGAYVRKGLWNYLGEVEKSLEHMSYMKLELIKRKKMAIYDSSQLTGRNRGDIKFLQRNEKQYFWSFNGEFWADELGDYVFSLQSECK